MAETGSIINQHPKLLIIAGSDSGGGAGIQADIKTAHQHGVYATTAITALTAQNTREVSGIFDIAPTFVAEQIEIVLTDIGSDAIKIGMLNNAPVITAVATSIDGFKVPVVLDTVMVSKAGAKLLRDDAIAALKEKLIPLATLVTPNIPEAEILTGKTIRKMDDMVAAGKILVEMGAEHALIKGGHIKGSTVYDVVVSRKKFDVLTSEKIDSKNTHGTGCTLSTAIACHLSRGDDVLTAVEKAREFVRDGITSAFKIGNGNGPLNHFVSSKS